MATSNAALNQILDQADEAASNFQPPAIQQAPANLPTPANNNTALAKPTLANFLDAGGMSVDAYFKVDYHGFKIGDDMKGLLEEVVVDIDVLEVTPVYTCRVEVGGFTKFIKSYDGQSTATGGNFAFEVAAAERQPGANSSGPYQTYEIPCTLVEDVVDPKNNAVSFDAGAVIGLAPSVTGAKEFQNFLKKLRKVDPSLMESTLRVKLKHKPRSNPKGNKWGLFEFEYLGEAD